MCQFPKENPSKDRKRRLREAAETLPMLLRNKKRHARGPLTTDLNSMAPSLSEWRCLLPMSSHPGEGVLYAIPSMSACENRRNGIQYHTWVVCANRLGAEVPNHLSLDPEALWPQCLRAPYCFMFLSGNANTVATTSVYRKIDKKAISIRCWNVAKIRMPPLIYNYQTKGVCTANVLQCTRLFCNELS